MLTLNINYSGLNEDQLKVFSEREHAFREKFFKVFKLIDESENEVKFEYDYVFTLNQFQPKVIPEEFQKQYSDLLDMNQGFYLEFFTN